MPSTRLNLCLHLLPCRDCVSHAVTALAILEVCTTTAVELEAPECGHQTLGVVCVADGCYRDHYGHEWMCGVTSFKHRAVGPEYNSQSPKPLS